MCCTELYVDTSAVIFSTVYDTARVNTNVLDKHVTVAAITVDFIQLKSQLEMPHAIDDVAGHGKIIDA